MEQGQSAVHNKSVKQFIPCTIPLHIAIYPLLNRCTVITAAKRLAFTQKGTSCEIREDLAKGAGEICRTGYQTVSVFEI